MRPPLPALLLFGCGTGDVSVLPPDLDPPADDCVRRRLFQDADEDGYGDPAVYVESCRDRAGYVDNSQDCDDRQPGAYPGAIEICDEVDWDCDGSPDAGAVDAPFWYTDLDGDGFGAAEIPARACEGPTGTSAVTGDCDDRDPSVFPGADDALCDGIDQDCSGSYGGEAAQQGGRSWSSLQMALNEAGPARLWVCPGEHVVSHVRRSGLDLVGFGGSRERVVLTAPPGARLLDIEGESLHLEGLTLRGGATAGDGGAVRAVVDFLEATDLIVVGNRADGAGGALWVSASRDEDPVVFRRVTFRANHAGGDGGAAAVELRKNAVWILDDVSTVGNEAGADGGAFALIGAAKTVNVWALSARSTGDVAGGYGGWFSVRSPAHVVFRSSNLDLVGGRARRGGLIAIRAPSDCKLDLGQSRLLDGVAAEGGGLVWQEGLFTLDSEIHDSDLGRGEAPVGGLIALVTGGTGHLDWLNSVLHHGRASAGSALWVQGRSTYLNGQIRDVEIRDQEGAPAVEVSPEFIGFDSGMDVAWSSWVRNAGGAFSAPAGWSLNLTQVDLGAGPSDNGPWDIRTGSATYRVDGVAESGWCRDGVCVLP